MAVERFQAPNGGQAFRTGAGAIPKGEALLLENVLTHHVGKLPVRGPFGPAQALYTQSELDSIGSSALTGYVWTFDANFLVAAHGSLGNKFFTLDTDIADAPTFFATVAASNIYALWTRSARIGDFAYGFQMNLPAGGMDGNLLKWAGTAVAPTIPDNTGTKTPRNNQGSSVVPDLTAHLGRLFVCGTGEPGVPLSPVKPNYLYWSDINGPTANLLSDWQDDASGLVNKIAVGSQGDPCVALGSLRNQLVIAKRNSIYVLLGDTPSTFVLRRLVNGHGCIDARSMRAFDDFVVWMSRDGLMLYDGSSITPLGGPQPTVIVGYGSTACSVAPLSRDHVMVTMQTSTGSEMWIVHLPTRAWAQVTTSFSVVNAVSSVVGWPFVFTNEIGDTMITDRRYARGCQWLVTDDDTKRTGRELAASGITSLSILARWRTRVAQLAHPTNLAQIKRLFIDHRTVDPLQQHTWQATVQDGDGDDLWDAPTFETGPSADDIVIRTRYKADIYGEAAEALIDINFYGGSTTPGPGVGPELHDLWLEYEPGQQK
jgi:hypothetical protein